MGSIKKLAKIVWTPIAATSVALNAAGKAAGIVSDKKKTSNKLAMAAAMNAGELQKEKEDTAKRRLALYATSGDEMGEEVFDVKKSKRGRLFGNEEY